MFTLASNEGLAKEQSMDGRCEGYDWMARAMASTFLALVLFQRHQNY